MCTCLFLVFVTVPRPSLYALMSMLCRVPSVLCTVCLLINVTLYVFNTVVIECAPQALLFCQTLILSTIPYILKEDVATRN